MAGRKAAKVVSGPRGPILDTIKNQIPDQTSDGVEKPIIPTPEILERLEGSRRQALASGKVLLRSRHPQHMVLLISNPDKVTTEGRIEKGQTLWARFKDGEFRATPEELRLLQANEASYGVGKDYWLAEEEDDLAAKAVYDNFLSTVTANPKLVERLKKDLSVGDFKVVEALAKGNRGKGPGETEVGKQLAGQS